MYSFELLVWQGPPERYWGACTIQIMDSSVRFALIVILSGLILAVFALPIHNVPEGKPGYRGETGHWPIRTLGIPWIGIGTIIPFDL